MRALVVDDSKPVRIATRAAMTEAGFQVEEAENGAEALELLKADSEFDVIVTDVHMPEMDGIELATEVRDRSEFDRVGILMVTTEGSSDAVAQARKVGVDGWIMKPFQPEGLTTAVSAIIEKRHQR